MTKLNLVLVALMGLVPGAAFAHGPHEHPADPDLNVNPSIKDCSVQFAPDLTQSAFRRFVREFGSLGAFKMMAPPMTLGTRGVAVAVEQISFTIEEHADAWNDTFYHPDAYHELGSDLNFPKLRMRVGIGERIDLGAFWTRNPNANYGWFGAEARYGLLRQTENTPISLALRGAYTKTLYIDDMDMHAFTADISGGRTFWKVFTPYVALGSDLVLASERTAVVDLESETQFVPHAIGGVELRYWHLTAGMEAHVADVSSFQLQVGAIF